MNRQLLVLLPLLLTIGTTGTSFTGIGKIETGWRELDCLENCILTELILENVTRIDTQEEITPANISWEINNYQRNYMQEINKTRVHFTREIGIDSTNFGYSLTVWVDESYGLVEINVSRIDQQGIVIPLNLTGTVLTNTQNGGTIMGFILNFFEILIIFKIKQKRNLHRKF